MKHVVALFMTVVAGHALQGEPVHSALWGKDGELASVEGRLPDFSLAGYRSGEKPIPELPATTSVTEFGATGDGTTDDTEAFLKAVDSGENVVIHVPAGRYVITNIIEIRKRGVVLRGDGPGKTVLFFPKPLNEIKPNWGATTGGRRTSNYSWSGGFLRFQGSFRSTRLTTVAEPATRGDDALTVSASATLAVGKMIEVYESDTEANSLASYMYSGDPGDIRKLNGKTRISMTARVTAVNGNTICIQPALRFDVRSEWKPQIRAFEPTVEECGVENMTLEFPNIPYKGHFTELGSNGIAMYGVANCWVTNVEMLHADSGVFLGGRFCTLDGVTLNSQRKVDGQRCTGHHGITLGGSDNLLKDIALQTRFIHDITVTSGSSHNVVAGGKGVDISFDHHRRAPYQNLFTDVDIGAGRRPWHCGGGASLGKHCGARTTFWGIRSKAPIPPPPRGFGPASLNLVGLHTNKPGKTEEDGTWFEVIPPAELSPVNLYEAQLARRLAGENRFWP